MQRNLDVPIRDLAENGWEFECLTRIEINYAACESFFRALANQISFKKIVQLKKRHLRLN